MGYKYTKANTIYKKSKEGRALLTKNYDEVLIYIENGDAELPKGTNWHSYLAKLVNLNKEYSK